MPECAVATCKKKKSGCTKGTVYHSFPKDKQMVAKWVNAMKRKDRFRVETSVVCSEHFGTENYERDLQHELLGLPARRQGMLKDDAVPNRNLPGAGIVRMKNCRIKKS